MRCGDPGVIEFDKKRAAGTKPLVKVDVAGVVTRNVFSVIRTLQILRTTIMPGQRLGDQ